MNLKERIPVEELDELRLARIERSVLSELPSLEHRKPATRLGWLLPVTGVALAAAALLVVLRPWGTASQDQKELAPALALQTTELTTGPGESTELRLGEARVQVSPETKLSVHPHSDGRTLIDLEYGAVECNVDPRPNRPTFQVRSDDVMVTVVGTLFRVERDDVVRVSVTRGVVSVRSSQDDVTLKAGDSWRGSPFAHLALADIDAQREHEVVLPDDVEPARKRDGGVRAASNDGPKDGSKRRTPKTPDGVERPDRIPTKVLKIPELLANAKPIPPVFAKSASPELAALKELSVKAPRKAVVELQTLAATSSGKEASFALYVRAYLLLFKLGQPDKAAKAALQYARRFPNGNEAEDMLWLRVRALCKSGDVAMCRAAAHTYLRKYPNGVFRRLASKLIRAK